MTGPAGERPVSVVVVEDERMLRKEVADYLTRQGMQVRAAGSGPELERLLREAAADVVVLDLGLPAEDGIAVAERLRARADPVGIVMMTARGRVEERILGYRSGADVYLVKPIDFGELVAAIQATLRPRRVDAPVGDALELPELRWQLDLVAWRLVAPSGAAMRITRTEMQLLDCITENPGTPVSRDDISRRMGRPPGQGHDRTIDQVVSRFRRKVSDVLGWEAPIGSAHNQGYFFVGDVVRSDDTGPAGN